jgi:GT2 family glycosyltransferase
VPQADVGTFVRSVEARSRSSVAGVERHPVAVVVVNYNGGKHLLRCLESIERQTHPPDRVFVVDNASTDGSLQDAERAFPQIRYIRNNDNVGFAAANNHAFALCVELGIEFVATLNPDAFAAPDWLERLLEAAVRSEPAYGSWASCLLRADLPREVDGLGDAYHLSGSAWRRHHGRHVESARLVDQDVFCACAAAALYRLDAVQRAGAFDADLFCYMEDVDLGFRLRLLGYRCAFVAAAVVEHVGSGTTGYRSNIATYYGQRNLVWVFLKNMPVGLLWLLLPAHLLANAVMLLACAFRGQLGVALRAKLDALKGLGGLPGKRRKTQTMAVVPARVIWRALDKSVVRGN